MIKSSGVALRKAVICFGFSSASSYSIPGFVDTMTAEGEVEFVSQQCLDYFGKTLEELKNWASSDGFHPDDLPRAIDARKRELETGRSGETEHRLRRADGVYTRLRKREETDLEGRLRTIGFDSAATDPVGSAYPGTSGQSRGRLGK
jgi:PAS domain-containing protein